MARKIKQEIKKGKMEKKEDLKNFFRAIFFQNKKKYSSAL